MKSPASDPRHHARPRGGAKPTAQTVVVMRDEAMRAIEQAKQKSQAVDELVGQTHASVALLVPEAASETYEMVPSYDETISQPGTGVVRAAAVSRGVEDYEPQQIDPWGAGAALKPKGVDAGFLPDDTILHGAIEGVEPYTADAFEAELYLLALNFAKEIPGGMAPGSLVAYGQEMVARVRAANFSDAEESAFLEDARCEKDPMKSLAAVLRARRPAVPVHREHLEGVEPEGEFESALFDAVLDFALTSEKETRSDEELKAHARIVVARARRADLSAQEVDIVRAKMADGKIDPDGVLGNILRARRLTIPKKVA